MIRRFLHSEHGSPSAEFALMLPGIIVLLFGGFEAGNFMWTQHKLVMSAREGARYAARLPVTAFCELDNYDQDSPNPDAIEAIRIVTSTGYPPGTDNEPIAPVRMAGLSVQVSEEVCGRFSSKGIYTQLGTAGPWVEVTAQLNYSSLFSGLGVLTSGIPLSATSRAAVIGI